MDGGDTVVALRSAFDALAPIAPPARLATVLRRAVLGLLEEETVPEVVLEHSGADWPAPRRRNRYASQPGIEAWIPLRARVLAELAARGISRRQLAQELKIGHATLKPTLLPRCRAPSKTNRAKFKRWLERPPQVPTNGNAAPQHNEDATITDTPTKLATLPAYRLSVAQREKLAGDRELDERTLRKSAGVTLRTVDAAIAGGRDLAPEIVGRLVGFLEQQQPAAE